MKMRMTTKLAMILGLAGLMASCESGDKSQTSETNSYDDVQNINREGDDMLVTCYSGTGYPDIKKS